ncbi:MAG: alpha/beta hydrolase [Pseudomonadota bacterium]
MSLRASLIQFVMKRTIKKQMEAMEDMAEMRRRMAEATAAPQLPAQVIAETVSAGGVPCEWLSTAASNADDVLIYLHGGGFVLGWETHRDIGWRLAEASGMRVLLVDYRLAPENPFPAALDDATTCYRWLLEQGIDPANIALGGDSAGGGLCLSTLVNLKNLGLPLPNSCVLLSPWVDLTLSGDTLEMNAAIDPMLSRTILARMADAYLGNRDPRAPLASPLFADLRDLPPTLIQVGGNEVLLSDAQRIHEKLRSAGVNVQLEEWPKMPHVFQVFAARIPEGKAAIAKLGSFLADRSNATHE